jgi:hypothetical protein
VSSGDGVVPGFAEESSKEKALRAVALDVLMLEQSNEGLSNRQSYFVHCR